jgi:hypothetical protein
MRRDAKVHLAALLRWRDIYTQYLKSDESKVRDSLRKELEMYMESAESALDFAQCDVAAPNESGEMQHGLSSVVSALERRGVPLQNHG